ncbi:MAG: hypothetical protein KIT11_10705 [Fimbriimonadaceae bacterium]|nr:hypothetical protein [Fimbriimonadaceae bacterium]QYK55790.1 MAG: hypothetical protein KF733_12375 [Fimbriimonadaceae bacterium]
MPTNASEEPLEPKPKTKRRGGESQTLEAVAQLTALVQSLQADVTDLRQAVQAAPAPAAVLEPEAPTPVAIAPEVEEQSESVLARIRDQIGAEIAIDRESLMLELQVAMDNPEEIDFNFEAVPEEQVPLQALSREEIPQDLADAIDRFNGERQGASAAREPRMAGAGAEDVEEDSAELVIATVTDEEIAALFAATDAVSQSSSEPEPAPTQEVPKAMAPESDRTILSEDEIKALLADTQAGDAASPTPVTDKHHEAKDPEPALELVAAEEPTFVEEEPAISFEPKPTETVASVPAFVSPTIAHGLHPRDAALRLVPGAVAASALAVPLSVHGDRLLVAVCEPVDQEGLDAIAKASGKRVETQTVDLQDIVEALRRAYGGARSVAAEPVAEDSRPSLVTKLVAWIKGAA